MSVLVFSAGPFTAATLLHAFTVGIALFLSLLIPHAFAQNGTAVNDLEMAGIGAARGAVYAAGAWFMYPVCLAIIPVMMLVQSLSYAIGYGVNGISTITWLNGPTNLAEFIWGIGVFMALAATVYLF
jgi:hypothetical protein